MIEFWKNKYLEEVNKNELDNKEKQRVNINALVVQGQTNVIKKKDNEGLLGATCCSQPGNTDGITTRSNAILKNTTNNAQTSNENPVINKIDDSVTNAQNNDKIVTKISKQMQMDDNVTQEINVIKFYYNKKKLATTNINTLTQETDYISLNYLD